ncbi:MAG TPA: MFS transporter [Gaiellaceae bacterium]|nr:MFS transporter [Gaiellaceae bacterium]
MHSSRYVVLTAMIFAVAMMSVDQTIVAIAAPTIQRGLSLSSTGVQWVINAYLLALAALFALGGKLSDVFGHRRMVLVGTVGFGLASVLCGATPGGSAAATWLITSRVLQGTFGALLFPAALAIVFNAFAARERGKALALFFGISGGLTSIGPIAGSFLLPWTWRAIFFINVPVALVALALTLRARPVDERRRTPIDVQGAILVSAGMALAVLGLQQAGNWGWSATPTWACLAGGVAILAAFVRYELRAENPLIEIGIFAHRGFAVDNVVMGLTYACFLPLFFFASVYAQVVLGYNAGKTGLYILVIFLGFAGATQIGGRILDRRGARPAAVLGSALGAVGFFLWARHLHAGLGSQWPWIVLAGAGLGLTLTPTTTDAVNRAPRGSFGEVTGITQTVRYFAASLGLAILGSVLIRETRSNARASLARLHIPQPVASKIVASIDTGAGTEHHPGAQSAVFTAIQHDFAQATRVVYLAMAGIMAASFLVAVRRMERGIAVEVTDAPEAPPLVEAP